MEKLPTRMRERLVGCRKIIVLRRSFDGLNERRNRYSRQKDAQKGLPARPQRVKIRGVPGGYVEGLNDARTKLEDFFSILIRVGGARTYRGQLGTAEILAGL
jgi:hypothetical protein